MLGRKQEPVAVKLLEGNPGKRKIPLLPRKIAFPTYGIPYAPDFLDPVAYREWHRVMPILWRRGHKEQTGSIQAFHRGG